MFLKMIVSTLGLKTYATNIFVVALALLGILPSMASADIHKCKDKKGKITYSTNPCSNTDAQLPVGGIINYENSPEGRQDAAIRKSAAEVLRAKDENDIKLYEKNRALEKRYIPTNRNYVRPQISPQVSAPDKDVGLCMGDCASEQGICIAQCETKGSCIANCASAWGRCASRCN